MSDNSLDAAGARPRGAVAGGGEGEARSWPPGSAPVPMPTTVADALADAVRDGRFWVLPQPELAYGALDRVQRIVDGRPPVDLLG